MVVAATDACRSAAITSSIGATANRWRELTELTACSARRCARGRSVGSSCVSLTSSSLPDQAPTRAGQGGGVVRLLEAAPSGAQPQHGLERLRLDVSAGA